MTTTHVIPANRQVMIETKIHIIQCAACSIDFGIGDDFMARRLKDHQEFYCPNGHLCYFKGPSELEKERDRLKRLYDLAEARADSWRDQAQAAERARRGQKAANTKLKKRIAAGVCPCCQRSFQNLSRHMSGQHPDYAEATS